MIMVMIIRNNDKNTERPSRNLDKDALLSWVFNPFVFVGIFLTKCYCCIKYAEIIAGDLRMTYKDRNVSLKATMMSLGSDLDVLKALAACSPRNTSCHGRTCSVLERRTKHSCYCDDICVDSGDCCFDYYDT